MGRIAILFVAIALLILPLSHQKAEAQQTAVSIYGGQYRCVANNGQMVPIYFQTIPDAAMARADPSLGYIIILNPSAMNQLNPYAAVFVFFHECAHVALPMGVGLASPYQETNADCYAIRAMRDRGMIPTLQEFQAAVSAIANSTGSMMHPPGYQRVQNMANCISY